MCRLHVQKPATLNQFLIQYNCQISFTFISSRAINKRKKMKKKSGEIDCLRFSSFVNGFLSFFTHTHLLKFVFWNPFIAYTSEWVFS